MAMVLDPVRCAMETTDRAALVKEEEAVEVASAWAQEKLDNFLLNIETEDGEKRMLRISYVISRKVTVDVFSGKSSDIGEFAKDLIKKLADGKVMEGLSNLAGTLLNKLFGAAAGSAQTERIYDVAFDELGGLNRLDAFFFCYRFASSGLTNFSKAVIGTAIVRSAAAMVDDNAYRVILTSSATLQDAQRAAISEHMIGVAANQKTTINEAGVLMQVEPGLMEARAKLAQVIGEGVAGSDEFKQRRTRSTFAATGTNGPTAAEASAGQIAARTATVITSEPAQVVTGA